MSRSLWIHADNATKEGVSATKEGVSALLNVVGNVRKVCMTDNINVLHFVAGGFQSIKLLYFLSSKLSCCSGSGPFSLFLTLFELLSYFSFITASNFILSPKDVTTGAGRLNLVDCRMYLSD